MDLNANKWLMRQLCTSTILLFLAVMLFMLHHARFTPSGIGFLYFIVIVGNLGHISFIMTDMITTTTSEIHGQIVHKKGRTIHVSQQDGKLGKYKVHASKVLERVKNGQLVNIVLTKFAHIPSAITFKDNPMKLEDLSKAEDD